MVCVPRRLVVLVAFVGAGACSAVLGIHDPVVEAVVVEDAAAVAPVTSMPSAADVSQPDAASCTGPGDVCDDFERDEVRGRWDGLLTTENATAAIRTTDRGRVLTATSLSAIGAALLEKTLPGELRRLRYEIDARYDALPTGGSYLFLRASTPLPGDVFAITYVVADSSGVWFVQQRSGDGAPYLRLPLAASAGAWHRFLVEYEIGGELQVSVDGAVQIGPRPTESSLAVGVLRLSVGVAGVDVVGSGFTYQIDNLRLHAE